MVFALKKTLPHVETEGLWFGGWRTASLYRRERGRPVSGAGGILDTVDPADPKGEDKHRPDRGENGSGKTASRKSGVAQVGRLPHLGEARGQVRRKKARRPDFRVRKKENRRLDGKEAKKNDKREETDVPGIKPLQGGAPRCRKRDCDVGKAGGRTWVPGHGEGTNPHKGSNCLQKGSFLT